MVTSRATDPKPGGARRAPRPRWRGLALGVLLAAGCSAPPDGPPRPSGPRGDLEAARKASAEAAWSEAAAHWVVIFRRGGRASREACREGTRALLELGELEQARALVQEGLVHDPGDLDLLELKGNVLAGLGFRRAAEACYDEVLTREPERSSTLFARARLRLELGLATAARADLERSLAQGARDGETWLCYARALAATGQLRRAFDSFARAFELGQRDFDCLVAAAGLYFDGDLAPRTDLDRDQAVAWLRHAVALEPRSGQAHYWLALLLQERGDLDGAVASLQRSLDVQPEHLPSLERLAELLFQRGERQSAAEMARRALELERRPARRRSLERYLEQAIEEESGEASSGASR